MSSYLFVIWAGGGNVPPQLAIARRLVARGQEVRVLAPESLRKAVERTGAAFEPYVRAPQHDEALPESSLLRDFERRTAKGALDAARDRLLAGMASPIAADVGAVLDRHHVDVVAPDWMLLGALFAAELRGVPAAPLVHSVLSIPVEGMPAFGFGWAPATGWPGRLRDRFGRAMFERGLARPLLGPLNRTRRDLGLAPLRWAFEPLFEASRLLVLSSAAFDYPARFPGNVRYVGPQLDDPDWHPAWSPPWDESDPRPLVVASMSTTYQAHQPILARVVDGLGRLPVRAVVTTGPGVEVPDPPPNVHVEVFVPHQRVVPAADLVVCHAGHGTVIAALAAGVPLVCLPVSRDQPDIAARVEWHGAGRRISRRAHPTTIAATVEEVLTREGYRASARRLATAMAAEQPHERAVSELEALGPSRRVSSV